MVHAAHGLISSVSAFTTSSRTRARSEVKYSQRQTSVWASWRPVREDQKAKFKTKVMGADGTGRGKSLVEIQKQIEDAAQTINYSTKSREIQHRSRETW